MLVVFDQENESKYFLFSICKEKNPLGLLNIFSFRNYRLIKKSHEFGYIRYPRKNQMHFFAYIFTEFRILVVRRDGKSSIFNPT